MNETARMDRSPAHDRVGGPDDPPPSVPFGADLRRILAGTPDRRQAGIVVGGMVLATGLALGLRGVLGG